MWEGPPTDKIERSGKVKDKQGKGLGEKKGRREGKLHNCQEHLCSPCLQLEARGDGRVVREMRGCRGDGVAGKGKVNRGRGRGVAAEVLLELRVGARRGEGQH